MEIKRRAKAGLVTGELCFCEEVALRETASWSVSDLSDVPAC